MISLNLSLDRQTKQIELSENQFNSVYQPVMKWIVDVQQELQRRILIGIAGPPGCGKTFFSHVISELINREDNHANSIVVGMDGWHYPNQLLEEKNINVNGELQSLKRLKGAPETFDVTSFVSFLQAAKKEDDLSYPIYDRNLHEPVTDGGILTFMENIVLVEGNYLLLNESPWQQIRTFLDGTIFIEAGEMLCREILLQRHLQGGKTAVQALHHIRNVDMVNTRRIGRPKADIYLRRLDENKLILFT